MAKEGKKKYGAKMKSPRIRESKEKRSCGPLGYFLRAKKIGKVFTTRAALFPIKVK
jgi:hypothetical protein